MRSGHAVLDARVRISGLMGIAIFPKDIYLKKKKLNNIRIIFVEIDNIMKHYH